MSKPDTWMPLYVADYLADTGHLRLHEHGAYMLMLMHYWRNGPLPDDDRFLSGLARMTPDQWAESATTIRAFFEARNGRLHQKRMDQELAAAKANSEKKRKAANSRWDYERGTRGGGGSGGNGSERNADASTSAPADEHADASQGHVHTQCPSPSPRLISTEISPPFVPHAPPKKTRLGKSRLPDDWVPDHEQRAYALARGLNPDATGLNFRDYWVGHGKLMANWNLTWQRWCRVDAERSARSGRKPVTDIRADRDERILRAAGLWEDGETAIDHPQPPLIRGMLQ